MPRVARAACAAAALCVPNFRCSPDMLLPDQQRDMLRLDRSKRRSGRWRKVS